MIYALLLSPDESMRTKQLKELTRRTPQRIADQAATLWPEVSAVSRRARLPLVDLAIPGLRQFRPEEFKRFDETLTWLIESDRQIDLFEFVLRKIVNRHLEPQFGQTRKAVAQFYSIKPLLPECTLLLSALAHVGSADPAEILDAFNKGAPYLRAVEFTVQLLPRSQCGLSQLEAALDRLALAVPQIKKNLLEACVYVVGADGVIQENEAELLRAVADTLDCPMPPFVQME